MRALLYLLTLTFSCFLKNGYCVISFKEFISNDDAMSLVRQYHNNEFKREELLTELNNRGHEMNLETLKSYIKKIKKAGGGSRINNFDQFKNDPRAMFYVEQYNNNQITKEHLLTELNNIGHGMSISTLDRYLANLNEAGGGSRINFDQLKKDPRAMFCVEQYHNRQIKVEKLLTELNNIGYGMSISTLYKYLNEIEEAGGGSRINFDQINNDPRAMSLVAQYHNKKFKREKLLTELNNIGHGISLATLDKYLKKIKEAGGGSRINNFDHLKNNPDAMSLVRQYYDQQNKEIITKKKLSKKLEEIGLIISETTLANYLKKLKEEAQQNPALDTTPLLPNQSQSTEFWDFSNPAPLIQAPQIARQSSNFTSGNPGSSTSALKKGKSTNFSKASNPDNWSLSSITGSSSHYGDAMPFQQVPPMDDDTFVPSQAGTDSTNWFGENLQSNDGSLQSMVNPKNPSLFKNALGSVSSWFGSSQQEPQFSPSMHDTAAASSYYPSNQPDDQTLESMITPRNQKDSSSYYGSAMPYQQVPPMDDTFVPSQVGTDSTNFFGWNSQNNDGDLASVIRKSSSSEGFYGTPYFPNQSQSMGWPGASNIFSPTPNTSNFTSGNPGSSAIPFQQAPMTGTSFSAFPNYPNQSAQLNSSTIFGPSQTETHSLDWSGENSHNNTGTLDSMFNTSSSKSTSKKGKKPRK